MEKGTREGNGRDENENKRIGGMILEILGAMAEQNSERESKKIRMGKENSIEKRRNKSNKKRIENIENESRLR